MQQGVSEMAELPRESTASSTANGGEEVGGGHILECADRGVRDWRRHGVDPRGTVRLARFELASQDGRKHQHREREHVDGPVGTRGEERIGVAAFARALGM